MAPTRPRARPHRDPTDNSMRKTTEMFSSLLGTRVLRRTGLVLKIVFLSAFSLLVSREGVHAQTATPDTSYAAFQSLAENFWEWRAMSQPLSGDDITRIHRPVGWLPDWWPSSVEANRQFLLQYEEVFGQFDTSSWSTPQYVDYRLMRSALARVRWELIVFAPWRTNPLFYIDQTLGSLFRLLLEPVPFDTGRSDNFIATMEHIRTTVESAKVNLSEPIRPFAELAIAELSTSAGRLRTVQDEIRPHLTGLQINRLDFVTDVAIEALADYEEWLKDRLPDMSTETAVGPADYAFFLREVALIPFSATQLLEMARQEWERAVVFETFEKQRNEDLPDMSIAPSQAAQIARNASDEARVRVFLEEEGILSVPDDMAHYVNAPLPSYLAPLAHMGVIDDLTGPGRLDENGIKYIRVPTADLGYFALATAKDSRPILVHEGIPGHYFQLVLSWKHENFIRRYYFDSGANEGIGFYAEEMMLQAGYFDDSPRTREIIYNFMRLRALRVEVDVKLATGVFSIAQAADYLVNTVPMDRETANWEAAFFASTPGQAISYQIGKIQIMNFMADARQARGDAFSLQDFHDFLWLNGNVPIALQRMEYLGFRE